MHLNSRLIISAARCYGLALKEPKRARHKRTLAIDDDLLALLCTEREKLLRIAAGVPDEASVDLSLVRLPEGALISPSPPAPGQSFSFTKLRDPTGSPRRLRNRLVRSACRHFGCTIFGEPTKRCSSTAACPCMLWRLDAGTIRRCCCAFTPSAQGRQT
jgi:hypothetical protein